VIHPLIQYVGAFIVLLGILVFFHEFGHFIVARAFGVGVEVFSFGFGRKLWSTRNRKTEYRISLIPLGGYVKMVGDEPGQELSDEQRSISFFGKPVWKRMLIVFAGPVFNILLAFLIFMGIFMVGYPQLSPVVGTVEEGSPAERAGIQTGDRILSIDGRAVDLWEDAEEIIGESKGREINLLLARGDRKIEATAGTRLSERMDLFGRSVQAWGIGIGSLISLPYVGIRDPQSPAYLAGLRTGDVVAEVNGEPIQYYYELKDRIRSSPGTPINLKAFRDKEELAFTLTPASVVEEGSFRPVGEAGIETLDLYIMEVVEDSPAQKAGIQDGDRILAVGGTPIRKQREFLDYVRSHADTPISIALLREGNRVDVRVVPELARRETETGEQVRSGKIGVLVVSSQLRGVFVRHRYLNPLTLMHKTAQETWKWCRITGEAFYLIVTGSVPMKNLGGPIRIAKLAGDSAKAGVFPYVFLMAVISLNLALINLVPIPILDGGHLLIFSVEAARRKPLSIRTVEIANRIGLSFILVFIIFIFYNDIVNIWPAVQDAIRGLFQ